MKISRYLYVIIVLCLTFTIFTYAPILNKYWYFYILAILLYFANRTFNFSTIAPLIVYAIVVLINTMIGDHVFHNIFVSIIELASLFIPMSILLFLLGKNDIKGSRLIVNSFMVLTIFTTIVSYSINATNPGIIRNAILYHINDEADFIRAFYAKGLSNYLLPHGLCILVPPLVLFVKDSSSLFKRLFYTISLIAVLTLVFISGSTTSLLLSIISLVLSFTLSTKTNERKNYRTLTWVMLIASPLLLSSDIQLYLLKIISDYLGDASIYQDKVTEFESVAMTGNAGVDMTRRANMLIKSLSEFASHPLWGTNAEVGGHNALMDRLAALGIIGIIPLILFFIRIYEWARPYFDNRIMPFVTLSVINGLIMLSAKNMLCWEVMVCLVLIMPIMFYIKSNEREGSINSH